VWDCGVIMDQQSRENGSDSGNNGGRIKLINKENNLIDDDDDARKTNIKSTSTTAMHQSSQRRVLLPALNPSRKLRTTATTATASSAVDDATHSSSSMLTSSTTSNASLRTNSTAGSNSRTAEDDNTLNSIGNETYLSIHTAGGQLARVLRYGETVDSLFCLSSSDGSTTKHGVDASRHRQLCQQVCHGELANDAKAWCEALVMTLQVNDDDCNRPTTASSVTAGNDTQVLGKRLIQLLRRATSRFKLVKRLDNKHDCTIPQQQQQEGEVLKLWLLYALVLLKYSGEEDGNAKKNDAAQTYRHIQRLRFGSTSSGVGVGSSTSSSSLSEDFYTSLLINNSNSNDGTTVDEVVRSLKETMDNPDTSLIDIFHTQLKQLERCCHRNNDNDGIKSTPTSGTSIAATTAATATRNTSIATGGGGGARVALPTLKGKRSNHHQHQIQREKTSSIDNKHKIDDAEDTFDLKLKTARVKLEEGLNNSNNTSSNNKRSLLKSGNDRSNKLLAARKKPRGTSGKLGAILSRTMDEGNDDDDDEKNMDERATCSTSKSSNISPKEQYGLFQDNISPIEAEPSTSIKDMDLDYLLSWDPTKRGSGGIIVSRKKKVTIAEEEEEEEDGTGDGGEEDAKQPVKKITRNDLGYMLNWEPFADRHKKEDESVDGSISSNGSSSKVDVPPKRSALSATQGMSTIDEGTEGSIERKEDNLIKAQAAAKHKEDSENAGTGSNDVSGADNQADTSEKMIPTSQLDCSFLPLIEKKNIIRVDGEPYAKLGVIGKGGSCKVYRALSTECDVVALKKVKLDGLNKQAIDGYANEIALLKRLKGNPAIIQLYSAEVDYDRKSILLVMELGEVDLNYVLRQQELLSSKQKSGPGRSSLNMNFIRLTWQQMLTAVHSIHEERIIHSDLKPANFLFVRGALKLIDFGIAKAIEREDTTNVYRETLSGTLSYMSPEAIMDTSTNAKGVRVNKCGRPSDIWSLGCILYQMVYGKTPFADCHGIPQKVLAITNVNHEIPYPGGVDESAIDAMKLCLQRNPKLRPPIIGKNGLLNDHYFLHGKTKSNQK